MSSDAAPGRIVFLSTSPRVALGLLSWPAWETLRAADVVFAGDDGHPQIPYIEQAAGSVVALGPAETPASIAERLLAAATPGRVVVWLTEDEDLDEELALAVGNRLTRLLDGGSPAGPLPELEILPGSYDLPGARLLDLVDVMNRLRSPGGCPWDAEQTHASLVKYLLEEAYETVETIEDGHPDQPGPGRDALLEELGDVLLQVMFHSRIAEEHQEDPFSIDDVADGIVAKLIRRHPHVFEVVDDESAAAEGAVAEPLTAAHVEAMWERNKTEEKQRGSVVEGVPLAQPALALAAKLASRARKAGLDAAAAESAAMLTDTPKTADELGELLLAHAVEASARDLDPEAALRAAARRFRDRIVTTETALARG
jgi:XTP/dITP diphosphohydrolase